MIRMDGKPLLIFPEAATTSRHKARGGPPKLHLPTPGRQVEILGPRLEELERVFDAHKATLSEGMAGLEPEKVLVLKTAGTVEDFYKAVRRIDGLEWLLEWDEYEFDPDDEFYKDEARKSEKLPGQLYLMMTNQKGLQELLSLWNLFRGDPDHPQFKWGQAKWKHVFWQLRDIHPWGPEDRLRETGLTQYWRDVAALGMESASVEIELWFREEIDTRSEAHRVVTDAIEKSGGKVLASALIEEIRYHALLAELPTSSLESIARLEEAALVRCDEVMFFRPAGQVAALPPESELFEGPVGAQSAGVSSGEPIVALLDGLPVENHPVLDGHLSVYDPDGWASTYPVEERNHGTAMASLIVRGDLNSIEPPLGRPVFVRPIMRPNPHDVFHKPRWEYIPGLAVDLIHRAVREIFEDSGAVEAVAPTVRIVNLSIGDQLHVFDHYPSPMARLIDYLSWKYKVLFVVSAGNYPDAIELSVPPSELPLLRANPFELDRQILQAIDSDGWRRRLRSPAETVNGLTIGALHQDSYTGKTPPTGIDPFVSPLLPSPVNAQGPGFRRSVKPDVLLPGGRQFFTERLGTSASATLETIQPSSGPGHLVAAPGISLGSFRAVRYVCGTSNATALATRTAARIHEVLNSLREEPGAERMSGQLTAVMVKALLVHGASWGESEDLVSQLLGGNNPDTLARLLGYGAVNSERVMSCTDSRATMLGWGLLNANEGHRFFVPLPPCLAGQPIWRRLTITLAWLTPISPTNSRYKRAAVWFGTYGDQALDDHAKELLQVDRREVGTRSGRRGTVQHEILESKRVADFADGAHLKIQVNCRPEAGDVTEEIPYALAVTLEVAEGLGLAIYNEVRARIRPAVRIEPASA